MSQREQEVANLCSLGLSNQEIAKRLGIEVKTVKFHLTNVFAKTQVTSRAQLIASHQEARPTLAEVQMFISLLR